ncbi:uncharacterized protein PAC_13254 [Phialocephala subalpina]|uniref:Uncharacterized protein n=1 Tax=Phialocephala subalpina TaxID=576137 RepID=A0A1L7XEH3_9HELO|nr:uncharacterized protein PAC_13254 [Phialocephala subalpina]
MQYLTTSPRFQRMQNRVKRDDPFFPITTTIKHATHPLSLAFEPPHVASLSIKRSSSLPSSQYENRHLGVSSWLSLPNFWSWGNSLPWGWNPINKLPPCGPDGKHTLPAAESSSTEALPLTSSEVASTSALAEAFSSMELAPVQSSQAAATSAEAVIQPVSSQIQDFVPAASSFVEPAIPSSQAQFAAAPLSTAAQAYIPASSPIQEVLLAASIVVVAINPPALSPVPDLLPSASNPADVVSLPASSLVPAIVASASAPVEAAPPTSSLIQDVVSPVSATAHIVELAAASSLVQEIASSPSTLVQDVVQSSSPAGDINPSDSPAAPTVEAAPSTQVDASIAPASSGEAVVPVGGHFIPADASVTIAPEVSAPPAQTKPNSKKSSKKASKTAKSQSVTQSNLPLYHNQTIPSNGTGASNGTSRNGTLTSEEPSGSTESPAPQCALPASPMCCTPTETIHGALTPATGFTCKPAMFAGPSCSGVSICCDKLAIDKCTGNDKENVLPPVLFGQTN